MHYYHPSPALAPPQLPDIHTLTHTNTRTHTRHHPPTPHTRPKHTHSSRGFGFVTFSSEDAVNQIMRENHILHDKAVGQ